MLKKKHVLLATTLVCVTGCHKKAVPSWPPVGNSGSPDKPFNVVWSKGDLNGLPLNPDWGTQIPTSSELPPPSTPPACVREPNTKPLCTDQDAVIDAAVFPNVVFCSVILASHIHGHANWMPVEYVGGMTWWNFADDWDYNLAVVPVNYAGLTNYNNSIDPQPNTPEKFIEAEFDSRETTDRFVTPWWTKFRQTAAGLDNDAINGLLGADRGRVPQAVVVGLFGLDCEHDCRSEVHPVYGLAVEASDHADDNVWAIFVRNWGNEGFCSQYDHQMNFVDNKITLMLPRASKGAATVDPATEFAVTAGSGIAFPTIEQVTGEGTRVTFTLPPPGQHALAELVLHLKWTNDTYSPPKWKLKVKDFKKFIASMTPNSSQPADKEEGKVEDYLRQLYPLRDRLSAQPGPNQPVPPSSQLMLQPSAASNVRAQLARTGPLPQLKRQSLTQVQSVPRVSPRPDTQKIVRDCEFIRAVCAKYNNAPPAGPVPNFPQLCSELNQPDACANAARRAQAEFQQAGPR